MDQIVESSPSKSQWNSKRATPHPGLPSAETATACRGYKIETRAIMGRHQPSLKLRLGKQEVVHPSGCGKPCGRSLP